MSHLVLLGDDIHFHERNCGSLLDYFTEAKKFTVVVHDRLGNLKQRCGDYFGAEELRPYLKRLGALEDEALFQSTYDYFLHPIDLFPLCQAECLAFSLATEEHWHSEPLPPVGGPERARAIFERLLVKNPELLRHNIAATMLWIDEWRNYLEQSELLGKCTETIVFNGSQIYARVLMKICQWYRTRVFVTETTFTGREYFLEERYSPISGRSDIRHRTVRQALPIPTDPTRRTREMVKAIGKLVVSENKNVKQPEHADIPDFAEKMRPTLLVVGQVANDFSLIEQKTGCISSIAFYKELIGRVLDDTNYNVVFNGHPWESKKIHPKRPMTFDALTAFRAGLSEEKRRRFAIRNRDNLTALGHTADRIALINSQAGVKLAYHCGLRPSTFGRPYYGECGFTDAYPDVDSFIRDVQTGRERVLLDLDGFEAVQEFLLAFLQYHVVTNGPSGRAQVKAKLEVRPEIRIEHALAHKPKAPSDEEPRTKPRMKVKPKRAGRLLRKLRKLFLSPAAFFRDARPPR